MINYIIIIFIGLLLLFLFIYLHYNNNKKNICVFTWYDDNIKEYADITSIINKKYCENNNYDYIVDNKRRLPDRHPSWERFPLFLKLLKSNKYDYIVWIDADACFRLDNSNSDLLNDIINKNINKDIIFSYDIDSDEINNGFIIIKNTEYSKKFCDKIISNKSQKCVEYYNKQNWEQECVRYLHNNNIDKLKEHSIILPFELIQSFNKNENKNSLIIHYAGRNKDERINVFNSLVKKYNI